ncbi:MAG: HAD-IG family 5'-nucleotidase [Deltaproteobacteria bacterium]|nr:HAD-IG family 5'-nucleotidase [Deltaproteobacteria bacterium]
MRELPLPLPEGAEPTAAPQRIPRAERVWVNRNLKLSSIAWVGFDMDYTLAVYDQAKMDSLQVDETVRRLVARGYPAPLSDAAYDHRFPIRGLLVDKRLGNVLKMNRFKVVRRGYHGLSPIPKETLRELYTHTRIRPHTPRYHWTDTLFSLAEVTAYSAIVEALERRGESVDYARLFQDVRESIDEAHRDGTVYARVLSDPAAYLVRDPHLAETLHKLRSSGKRLFLLTNSPASYTLRVMDFLLGGALPEYATFQQYFDVVIVAAQKPSWFQEDRPLFERRGESLSPVDGPLERGRLYEGGSLSAFERHLGAPGSGVLYVGDHIFGDVLRSKKDSAWRTALVVPELGAELEAHERCSTEVARQRSLDERRDNLEDELRFYQARIKELRRGDGAGESATAGNAAGAHRADEQLRLKAAIARIRGELRAVREEHGRLGELVARTFHPYWGSLLKQDNELSSFGQQVEAYADLYVRRVSCLRHYSPVQFFRSPNDLMPHEL